jgi:hypothetical protein
MAPEPNQDIESFYRKLIVDTAKGIQKQVCEANGIPLVPEHAGQMQPVPVYEENCAVNLLTTANSLRNQTEIKWAINASYDYLPAYYKKYKDPSTHKERNEIVVTADNYCIARFFAAKELMHCFVDDDGYAATNTIPLVHELIDDLIVGSGLNRSAPQTIVDEIAWIGATLYLIPDGWIPLLQKTQQVILEAEPSVNASLHLAQLIRVPEPILRTRLRHSQSPV